MYEKSPELPGLPMQVMRIIFYSFFLLNKYLTFTPFCVDDLMRVHLWVIGSQ